ncbi:AMIN domain-containing protein [Sphaerothrix gracilis]|uniref:AMIN domain-containing protein n=1 Tax=Sphaerothrix gracilis TaxID=3151835 RepID=UPI0031FCF516
MLNLLAVTAVITVAAEAAAQAAVLSQWSFDPSTRQLQLSLPADLTPQYFLLAEPARIVLDIPKAQVGAVPTVQTYSGPVRSIRVSQYETDTIRIVMELAPGVVLDPQQATLAATEIEGQNRWILQPLLAGEAAIATTPPAPASAEPAAIAPAAPPSPAPTATVTPTPALSSSPGTAAVIDETFISPLDPPATAADPDPFPEINSEGIGVSAASLLVGPDLLSQNALPETPLTVTTDLPETSATVSVPPLSAAAPSVTVPPLNTDEPSASPAIPERSESAGAIAPAPARPPEVSSETASEAATAPVSDAIAAEPTLPAAPPDEAESAAAIAVPPAPPFLEEPAEPITTSVPTQPLPELDASAAAETVAETDPDIDNPPFLEAAAAETVTPAVTPSPATPPIAVPPPTSPARPQKPPTIPFGQPLPSTEQSALPLSSQIAQRRDRPVLIPAGTVLPLQYTQPNPLALNDAISYQEVLVLNQDIRSSQTDELLIPKGALVLGRFDLTEATPRFIAQAISLQGQNLPLAAESALLGESQVSGNSLLRNSGVGAAAVTVLSGLSGIGLVAGAAIGAATAYAASPQTVIIQPNQIIQVQVLEDLVEQPI